MALKPRLLICRRKQKGTNDNFTDVVDPIVVDNTADDALDEPVADDVQPVAAVVDDLG